MRNAKNVDENGKPVSDWEQVVTILPDSLKPRSKAAAIAKCEYNAKGAAITKEWNDAIKADYPQFATAPRGKEAKFSLKTEKGQPRCVDIGLVPLKSTAGKAIEAKSAAEIFAEFVKAANA